MDRGRDAIRFYPAPLSGGTGSSRVRTSQNFLFARSRIRPTLVKSPCWLTDGTFAGMLVASAISKSSLYFDGSYRRYPTEIGSYRRKASALCSSDVFETAAVPPGGIAQQRAMRPFHFGGSAELILFGIMAFVEVWTRLTQWRWAVRVASQPEASGPLKFIYPMNLPVRPYFYRLCERFLQSRAFIDSGKRR